jgi:hypothetical protein
MCEKLRTNTWLWFAMGMIVFCSLGFVNLAPDAKGSASYWGMWGIFLRRDFIGTDIFAVLPFMTGVLALVALVSGWVLQAVLVAVFVVIRR